MQDPLVVREGLVIPGWELWLTTSRSGGPGGQHANKTSSRVTLHWVVATTTALDEPRRAQVMRRLAGRIDQTGELTVHVDSERSQHRNREEARARLAELVRRALRVRRRRVLARVPVWSRRKRLEAKARRGEVKHLRRTPPPE